jgi:hypothetical protein
VPLFTRLALLNLRGWSINTAGTHPMSLLGFIGFGKKPAPKLQSHLPPLPSKLFGELTGFDNTTNSRLGDRRRRPRLARDGALTLTCTVDGKPVVHEACIRDVSAEGVSLGMGAELPLGTRFTTELERLLGDGHVVLVYEVRRVVPEPAGRFFVGGALVEFRC